MAQEKSIEVKVELQRDAGFVLGDPNRLRVLMHGFVVGAEPDHPVRHRRHPRLLHLLDRLGRRLGGRQVPAEQLDPGDLQLLHRGEHVVEELPRLAHERIALRIFVGSILFANGLAKLVGITTITLGPYQANLIDRAAMRFILRFEGLENPANGGPGSDVPGLKPVVRFLLDNFDVMQWLITAAELDGSAEDAITWYYAHPTESNMAGDEFVTPSVIVEPPVSLFQTFTSGIVGWVPSTNARAGTQRGTARGL